MQLMSKILVPYMYLHYFKAFNEEFTYISFFLNQPNTCAHTGHQMQFVLFATMSTIWGSQSKAFPWWYFKAPWVFDRGKTWLRPVQIPQHFCQKMALDWQNPWRCTKSSQRSLWHRCFLRWSPQKYSQRNFYDHWLM